MRGNKRIIDPTLNVIALVTATIKRIDDLREAESKRVNELLQVRDQHYEDLRIAETRRVDAVRATDVAAVAVANERAVQQAQTLATSVATSHDAVLLRISTMQEVNAKQITQLGQQLTDRISSLEKNQYVKAGSSTGMRDMYGWIAAGLVAMVNTLFIVWSVFTVHH
jgi:hypothetical protein